MIEVWFLLAVLKLGWWFMTPTCFMEFEEEYRVIYNSKSEREEAMLIPNRLAGWTLPAPGWCKLNAHATCSPGIDHTAIGGVIRDENGRWLNGYTGCSGISSTFTAALRAIQEGLMLAWIMGIKQLTVESNSSAAVSALWDTEDEADAIYPIIKDCNNLLNRDWKVKLSIQPLSRNKVAHRLAKMGHNDPHELIVFQQPPSAVVQLLLDDYSLLISENRGFIQPQQIHTIKYKAKSEREATMLHHNMVVIWTPPTKGWCKLNADVSHVKDINHTAIGGVIRDENGLWLKGYTGSSGTTTMFAAHFSAIKEGLLLAWSMDIKHVIVELDSTEAYCALRDTDDDTAQMYPIINDCRNLFIRDWTVKIALQPISTNKVAQKLAMMGHDHLRELIIFEHPPAAAMDLFLEDYRLLAAVRK